ncbi:Rid family hydrolase [Amnibacterium sp.]|uniref:Rid family hydrolase n=1 Tax=Amnibacterium sp. TaxID=1872496 RepID=UPI0026169F76|nr:Rid family hydrolase [Amnibacterium sp.]MCU1475142.1 yjgF [Amnibacterium sp.]
MIVATQRAGVPAAAVVPEHWAEFYAVSGVPAALRVGDTIYVTGHDGEELDHSYAIDVKAQIRRTFVTLEETLAEAGAGLSDVVELHSYHVGLQAQKEQLLAVATEFLAAPFPAWTAVGVAELYDEASVVEISCTALVRRASGA